MRHPSHEVVGDERGGASVSMRHPSHEVVGDERGGASVSMRHPSHEVVGDERGGASVSMRHPSHEVVGDERGGASVSMRHPSHDVVREEDHSIAWDALAGEEGRLESWHAMQREEVEYRSSMHVAMEAEAVQGGQDHLYNMIAGKRERSVYECYCRG
eukprot:gene26944-4566_t